MRIKSDLQKAIAVVEDALNQSEVSVHLSAWEDIKAILHETSFNWPESIRYVDVSNLDYTFEDQLKCL